MSCHICGREQGHFFLHQIPDPTWAFGVKDVWTCHRCIYLPKELLGFIGDECLNSMEICRLLNGFEKDDFGPCYVHKGFSFKTRPERCNYKERGCYIWSFTVYNALRDLEDLGVLHSIKMRWFDKRKGRGKRTDVFRFWFKTREAFQRRIRSQQLDNYLS